jgi:two-component system, OmpR family, response regulator RegX3
MHIALLEDDADQLGLYQLFVEAGGHRCEGFLTAKAFADALRGTRYDLLVIDWRLPDSRGDHVIRMVRQDLGSDVPIIVLTVDGNETTVVTALRGGADDYIVKPPKPMELLARIDALLRRAKAATEALAQLGPYEIDRNARVIAVRGDPVELTQKEFDLAVHLFQNAGKLLSRVKLLEAVWGIHADLDTRTVDTHVSRIRRKLAIAPSNGFRLTPVYGFGYRLEPQKPSADSAARTASAAARHRSHSTDSSSGEPGRS